MVLNVKREDLNQEWFEKYIKELIRDNDVVSRDLVKLRDYYLGKHDILTNVPTTSYAANNKLVNNFPRFITTVSVGYFMGNAISYEVNESKYSKDLDIFKDVIDFGDLASVDIDLGTNASITGLAYEYITAVKDSRDNVVPKSFSLSPENTVVYYENTIEKKPLFGMTYIDKDTTIRSTMGKLVTICTDKEIYTFDGVRGKYTLIGVKPHYFGIVPIIEYRNNHTKQGDFEAVLTLIDAYNLLQSTRVNDKEQLVDAILAVRGINLEDAETVENIKTHRILQLPIDGQAEWLTKQLNEADTDVLRANLEHDIHKFSLTPNITDEQFSGNASGVAMQYKLFAFEQLIKTKERFYLEALRYRLTAYLNLLRVKNDVNELQPEDINIVFNRNLPTNYVDVAQMVSQLQTIVSTETLLSQIPFVKDVDVELERIDKEEDKQVNNAESRYGFPEVGVDLNEEDENEEDTEVEE